MNAWLLPVIECFLKCGIATFIYLKVFIYFIYSAYVLHHWRKCEDVKCLFLCKHEGKLHQIPSDLLSINKPLNGPRQINLKMMYKSYICVIYTLIYNSLTQTSSLTQPADTGLQLRLENTYSVGIFCRGHHVFLHQKYLTSGNIWQL